MWHTVKGGQKTSTRYSTKRNARAPNESEKDSIGIHTTETQPQFNPRALCKKLRAAAASLKPVPESTSDDLLGLVQRTVLPYVRTTLLHFLEESENICTCRHVHLLGLGIGPFHPSESKASFLQMAAFLAMRRECERVACYRPEHREPQPDAAASPPVHLRTSFFDPCTSSSHKECCRLLEVQVESDNKKGAYAVFDTRDEPALLLVYMPHCPWILLHNLFAANWPAADMAAAEAQGDVIAQLRALRRLHVVGNDPRDIPLVMNTQKLCVFHPDFTSLLSVLPQCSTQGENSKGKRKRGHRPHGAGDGDESNEGGYPSLGSSITPTDVALAFTGTACYHISGALSDEDLTGLLVRVSRRKPTVIKKSLELTDLR